MSRTKCPTCGLVNFSSASNCRRCSNDLRHGEPSISQAFSSEMRDSQNHIPTMHLPNWSVNGTGIRFYGYAQLSPHTYEVTRWLTLLYVPLLPFSTWEIQPLHEEEGGIAPVYNTKYSFQIIAKRPVSLKHIFLAYLTAFIALAPAISIASYKTKSVSDIQMMFTLIAIFWGFFIGLFATIRHDGIYTRGNK